MSNPLDFRSGDTVEILSDGVFRGTGLLTSFARNGSVRMATVERFDGIRYTVPLSELTKIED
jgi:alpha-acetolactate decarboxylase